MAAKAHSPSPHLTPCYFLYYPKKRVCCGDCFKFLLFGPFRAVNTQNLSTRVPCRMAIMLFPLETSIPTAVMMLFVMDFNLLIIFGDRCYSVPIQLALLFECGS